MENSLHTKISECLNLYEREQETTRKINLMKSNAMNQRYLANLTKYLDRMYKNIPKIALKEAKKGNKRIQIGFIHEETCYRTWYGRALFKWHYKELEKHMQDYVNSHPLTTHKVWLEIHPYQKADWEHNYYTGDWNRNYYKVCIYAELI